MKKVTIYSTPTCSFCHAAKVFFKKHNIEFTDYDVSIDAEKRKEMMEKSEQMSVPVIFIDDQMIIGFNENKIKELLEIV